MKKFFLLLASLSTLSGLSQETEAWRIGLQWGLHGNSAYLTGGAQEANARFKRNDAGSGALTVVGRFDLNKHWMLMSGLGFNTYGFEYLIAENYSLLSKDRHDTKISEGFGAFELPLMVHYKFNPNCKNGKWLVGLGVAQSVMGDASMESYIIKGSEMNANVDYISSKTLVDGGLYPFLRFSVGYEKVYRRGGILNLSFYLNGGFKEMARSTVNYRIDGQDYSHEFGNKGNYAGLKLSYFFRPLTN